MTTDGPTIALAGATGNLGGRIARELRARGADVRALVRPGASAGTVAELDRLGARVVPVDHDDPMDLARACAGAACVVSALSGLRDVVVDLQTRLLGAAIDAGVPRFVPSDFCIDYTKTAPGHNRNLDLRREFREIVDHAPLRATSVLNGAFAELLAGQAPIVLRGRRWVLYWEDADQRMDFTTMDDTAAFTAAAALDASAPRDLRVAGDSVSARDLATIASGLTGERFRVLRAGGLGRLRRLTSVMRVLMPGGDATYPPWQGMQYLYDMFSGEAVLAPLDNARYPALRFTSAAAVLARHWGVKAPG